MLYLFEAVVALMIRPWLRDHKVPDSKPDSTEDPPCMRVWRTFSLPSWSKCSPAGMVRKFGEWCTGIGVALVIWPQFEIYFEIALVLIPNEKLLTKLN
ncbi:hypothetical protein AVEN_97553-1 [Araneus ventricosus]|uniref:Uncharacterized protein n=1 Tax=Araneus ventricosus TaxID=182803 RepID=A0A4Y2J6N3_ARAVE|nr:hypothetical protein AVEN_97553-1 [Araneus ventricosus]